VTGNASPLGLDPFRAASGRVYDYLLGGKDNFAADREFVQRVLTEAPESRWAARQNRAFVERAVDYCARQGIRQFIDLGCGLPSTTQNVHQVARRVDRACRVVYADGDPMAVAHAQALLARGPEVAGVHGDLRRPRDILCHDDVRRLIDFSRPVAVLMSALLHTIPDADDPPGIVARFMDAVAPGSHLVLSHATHDMDPDKVDAIRKLYEGAAMPLATRSKDEVRALFAGLEMVEPGLVYTVEWRPPLEFADPGLAGVYAGVARKPG
jgi:SAM-dependent methyltransferase